MPPRPSARLAAYLSGEDLNPDASIQSWAQLEIHRAAIHILDLQKEEREPFLARVPSHIRPLVKAEANRVWSWRRSQ